MGKCELFGQALGTERNRGTATRKTLHCTVEGKNEGLH